MFDFVRKEEFFEAMEQSPPQGRFQLKTIQDYAILSRIGDCSGLHIGEIGGGASRVLPSLAKHNQCTNIEKFEGAGNGPTAALEIPGVSNVHAFIGEFSPLLADNSFDILFSISVVEHVPTPELDKFHDDQVRILKPGGLMLHAIDVYLENEPTPMGDGRCRRYRSWAEDERMTPLGPIYEGPIVFRTDMASNPDDIIFEWRRTAPALSERRKRAQCVCLMVASRKR